MCCKGIAIELPAKLDKACVSIEKKKSRMTPGHWPEQLEGW